MAARRQLTPPSPAQKEQSEWDRQLWHEVGQAIGRWMIDDKINLNRQIQSLTARELTGMAWAAISCYNNLLHERGLLENQLSPPPPLL